MLTIRRITKSTELKRFRELEDEYHYLGETHSGGDTMRLVVEEDGEWLAIMVWGSACYCLRPRDEFIGWTPPLRAERQKLVVNNRRFTILAKPGERRNLASQVLGLATRELPKLWHKEFHYRPLLAETFCDIEHSAGICYKADNWIPLGLTKGFSRVNRQDCDLYEPNGHPKSVWVKPLAKDAVATLCSCELPEDCRAGANCDAHGVLPLTAAQGESLYEALCLTKDWRDDNKSFPVGALLSIVVMGMMSGATSVKGCWRFAERLTMAQRKAICLPHAKSKAGAVARHEYKIPSYVTLFNFLQRLDLDDFGRRLSDWMWAQDGKLPRQLALDGKFVHDVMGVVSLVNVESGAPVAVAVATQKEGEAGKCEMPVGRRLLGERDLTNALVSSDALHCQQDTAREVLCAGGDHLMQIKGNQRKIVRNAKAVVKAHRAIEPCKKK